MPSLPRVRRSLPAWPLLALSLVAAIACGSSNSDNGAEQQSATPSPSASVTPTAAATPEPPPLNLLGMVLVTPDEVPTEIYAEYEALVSELTANVDDYWAKWFKGQTTRWQAPTVYPRSEAEVGLRCGEETPDIEGSYYCTPENYVAFGESRQLLPLYLYLGEYAVAMVISHEFGHAVQGSLGVDHRRASFKELQADCFAGVWFKAYQDEGNFSELSEPFTQAVGAMRTVDEGDQLAERYDALLAGFNGSPQTCIDLFPEGGFGPDLTGSE